MSLQSAFQRFVQAVGQAGTQPMRAGKVDVARTFYNYKAKQSSYLQSSIQNAILDMRKAAWQLAAAPQGKEKSLLQLLVLLEEFSTKEPAELKKQIPLLQSLVQTLPVLQSRQPLRFSVPSLPQDIQSDVAADIAELERSFEGQCYRSCVILCGRILEAALHRKYFDATGHDMLEKSPGIGLGNLIAKMKEKDIKLDPALTQQIHLINQVRIFSVHKKQEAFYPSKDQTQAIILYTLDVLRRLF